MRLSALDTHLVVALHALLEEASVTRAARRVGLTQPTMSHSLAKLRAHFDDPLLIPIGRTMTLSERAAELTGPAREAVAALERVFGPPPRFDPRTAKRTFVVATSDNLALLVLPDLAAVLGKDCPGINVQATAISPDWAERLKRGELDLKLGRAEAPTDGLRSTVLARERLVCLVRRGHPATRGRLTVKRFAAFDHLLVAPRGGGVGTVDEALLARRLSRRVALTVPHFLVAPFILARSDLILTVAARVAATLAKPLDLVTLPCPIRLDDYALAATWATRREGDEGHRWLRRVLTEAARSAPIKPRA